jgi:GTPase SAR1 family protein
MQLNILQRAQKLRFSNNKKQHLMNGKSKVDSKDTSKIDSEHDVKIILLGDSAVGKSKLMERYLLNDYIPYQNSTFALTIYRHVCLNPVTGQDLRVDFWVSITLNLGHSWSRKI